MGPELITQDISHIHTVYRVSRAKMGSGALLLALLTNIGSHKLAKPSSTYIDIFSIYLVYPFRLGSLKSKPLNCKFIF